MTTPIIPPAVRNRLAFWALAGLALFVAHDAVFLAQIGPGQALVAALRMAGHGYWTAASLLLISLFVVAGVSTWLRVRHLRRRVSSLGAAPSRDRAFRRRFLSAWVRLAAIVTVAFAIQENVEHLIAHGHAPIAGVLAPLEHCFRPDLAPSYEAALPDQR